MKVGDLVKDQMTGYLAIVTNVDPGNWVEIRCIHHHAYKGWSMVYLPESKLTIISSGCDEDESR